MLGGRRWNQRWRRLTDALRAQMWPIPVVSVLLALATGIALPKLDARIDRDLGQTTSGYLFSGNADAARAVLSSITTSMITVTSLTFSLTVVTLQLASSQFSPRLLRTFSRDRFVHVTLGLFLATFVFGLTILRSVHNPSGIDSGEVPEISITVAFILAFASVLALVFFLAHLAREIRVETMLRRVHSEASHTIRHGLSAMDEASFSPSAPPPPTSAMLIRAASSGFIVSVDEELIVEACQRNDVVVRVERGAGSMVTCGAPMARFWAADPSAALSEQAVDDVRRQVASAIKTEFERTAAEDIGFGLQQITDVAVKALSPGVNDPTTARHALGHSSALLIELSHRGLGQQVHTDQHGKVRLVLQRPGLGELLEVAVGAPRRYGAGDPDVVAGILTLLREVGWSVHVREQREAIADQLQQTMQTVKHASFGAADRHRLEVLAGKVEEALQGTWSVDPC